METMLIYTCFNNKSMLSIGELRPGQYVLVDTEPFVILDAVHSKQARAGAVCRTKIRNLKTGVVVNKTFQGNDKLKRADIRYQKCQYLYSDPDGFNFMNLDSFEQFNLHSDLIGEQKNFLKEDLEVDAMLFENSPIGIKLPPKVVLEVVQTDPGVKGDTVSGGSKPATLETGFVVSVPLFIKEGEKIRINTENKTYVERVS